MECPIFLEKAQETFKIVSEKFGRSKFKFLLNESETDGTKFEPRPGAFEIFFAKNCRLKYHFIWSGIDQGPPRRDKFPKDFDPIIRQIQKILVMNCIKVHKNKCKETYGLCSFFSHWMLCCYS